MQSVIRPCEKKDISRLIDLCEQHAAYEQTPYSREGKHEQLHLILFDVHPSLHCLVVEAESTIVGYATYTFDYSTWDSAAFLSMDCLYLAEGYRGYGIGEEIMMRLVAVAKEHHCINVQWQTPEFNERAIRFYRRMGAHGKAKMRFTLAV